MTEQAADKEAVPNWILAVIEVASTEIARAEAEGRMDDFYEEKLRLISGYVYWLSKNSYDYEMLQSIIPRLVQAYNKGLASNLLLRTHGHA